MRWLDRTGLLLTSDRSVPQGASDADAPVEHATSYIGSPMYRIVDEHAPAVVLLAAMVIAFWWLRRRDSAALDPYHGLSPVQRMLAWLLGVTGVAHIGLMFSHAPSMFTLMYLAGGLAAVYVLRRLLAGRPWRRVTVVVMLGLILGYAGSLVAGDSPDQLGLVVKLVELTALFIALRPRVNTGVRRFAPAATGVVVALTISLTGWAGAFSSGSGGHHFGETPAPGTLLPTGTDRPPTALESAQASALVRDLRSAIARYDDPEVARADGYDVDGLAGSNFHAENEAYKSDGSYLDPERPEALIYGVAASGVPVLLGALFQMDEIGQPGPAIGGPLTVWHAHDRVCFGVAPPALAGLTSPFGQCPLGSITMPVTNEMLHVWTLPGVGDVYGDVDDEWLNEYLASR